VLPVFLSTPDPTPTAWVNSELTTRRSLTLTADIQVKKAEMNHNPPK
jgi:hypothetical protein